MMLYFVFLKEFGWKEFLLGSEDWIFLAEVLARSTIMFTIILTSLALLGKRGVKQLSVFELVVIIGLGSAAGDPMFYKDVGVLPALLVFVIVITLYIGTTYFVGRNKKIEHLIEGHPVCLIQQGSFAIDNFKKEPLAQDEFFAELRMQGVSHLGQVEQAIIETSGEVSIFFYDEDEMRPGLPILPGALDKAFVNIPKEGDYSCTFCGYTEKLKASPVHVCKQCGKDRWIESSRKKRVT